jgi:hypothetical protein
MRLAPAAFAPACSLHGSPIPNPSARKLIATKRGRRLSSALYTIPMPPPRSLARMWVGGGSRTAGGSPMKQSFHNVPNKQAKCLARDGQVRFFATPPAVWASVRSSLDSIDTRRYAVDEQEGLRLLGKLLISYSEMFEAAGEAQQLSPFLIRRTRLVSHTPLWLRGGS